jgi:hypothetical protein
MKINKDGLLTLLDKSDLYKYTISMTFHQSIENFFDTYKRLIIKGEIEEYDDDENSTVIVDYFAAKFKDIYSNPGFRQDLLIKNEQFRNKQFSNEFKINSIKNRIVNEFDKITSSTNNNNNNSKGCYIATMAYGDYQHPQVIILRHFRDTVLEKSPLGRLFIKTYYLFSPQIVEILKSQKLINIFIRKSLNQFIKLIK